MVSLSNHERDKSLPEDGAKNPPIGDEPTTGALIR